MSGTVLKSSTKPLPLLCDIWISLLFATAIAGLCPAFTAYFAVYALVTLGLIGGSLAFMRAIYRGGKASLHPAFKKFIGYGIVLHYAAAALPRVDWAGKGLIGEGRVAYLFVLETICLAAGVLLFVASGRPSAFAALGLITEEEAHDRALRKKRFAEDRKKGIVRGALEWVDALGFAAILVILIQTFVFQLYEIPSESMVPAFLTKDRPFTSKLDAGPRIPLTDWRLPFLRLPKRGDIITLANPPYPENQSVNLKKYLAQFVSMVTFTAVNVDKYQPNGSVKADPLVKRVVGLPGEKLMMVDDVLYAKRRGDAAFAPVEADKAWARTDLWKEDPDRLARIALVPVDERQRQILDAWDARKRDADPAALAASIAASGRSILAKASVPAFGPASASFLAALEKSYPDTFERIAADMSQFEQPDPAQGNPISAQGTRDVDLALALSMASRDRRGAAIRSALADYASASAASVAAADPYVRGGRVLNLLIKDSLLKRCAREVEVIAAGASLEALRNDATLLDLSRQGGELNYYVNGRYEGLYDARNFPQFPAGEAYLGPTQYFAMGDNRYNSLDFRYRTESFSERPLDPADPSSVLYYSNVDPFPLDLRFIEGYALFRIWPPSRIGAIR